MPLNTLRLNHQPSSHPNERIVFIKPIPRPLSQRDDYNRAEIVLKAIAAQCLPIMKTHHLSITTLEEYEPNPEFIGRNFNNGEIIQLVIKSKSGAWLPLNMIQMVMMHELAHNTHMNHGQGFWQARNLYANEMRSLWSKGYTGEGLWGQGHSLQNLDQELGGRVLRSEELGDLPLCGGTFRSRKRKRKPKGPDLTWKEKHDKRIEKKFGKNGEKLGEDEDARMMLEIAGKGSIGGKPRVAQSKRGRELRAAAALARFDTNKKEVKDLEIKKEEDQDETETESEYEEMDVALEDARDVSGRKILDNNGRGVIRVCSEEDEDDHNVKKELLELASLNSTPEETETKSLQSPKSIHLSRVDSPTKGRRQILDKQIKVSHELDRQPEDSKTPAEGLKPNVTQTTEEARKTTSEPIQDRPPSSSLTNDSSDISCLICSTFNDPLRLSCETCAHVLDVRKDFHHWRCASETCKDSLYINAGDCGVCGVCGASKPVRTVQQRAPRGRDAESLGYSGHIAYI